MPEKWFDSIDIPLNPGLVAVIGNKGSGKTEITKLLAQHYNMEFISIGNKIEYKSLL